MRRFVFRLRFEEAVALGFLVPTTVLTIVAHLYAERVGYAGPRFSGGLPRIAVAAALLLILGIGQRFWPGRMAVRGARETVPFLACILIYTNLHDTIGFVNPHDVHDTLAAMDKAIFGVVPCVYAERFISRPLTELMQFFYLNFFWIAPSTALILLAKRRWTEFRRTVFGIILCFYIGYALYVIFPAAPPRLVLVLEFTKTLQGYPRAFSALSAETFSLLPVDSRAAFPSLHTAVSTVALVYAWRHLRVWFWILVPFVLGLWVSTIYLRHHFFVDLLAGWILAPVAMAIAPRIDRAWARRQRALGFPTALGAPD